MSNKPSFLRHLAWLNPEDIKENVTIIGCGAVGSTVALAAARMGFPRFTLWDMDIVEDHNLPNQAFYVRHIGMPKTAALYQLLKDFNPDLIVNLNNKRFEAEHAETLDGTVIMCVDSMAARKAITKAISYNPKVPRAFEARLGFDFGEIHCINPQSPFSLDAWHGELRDDSEVDEGPCSLRICTTLVGVVSSALVHYMCLPYASRHSGGGEFDLPFKTRFFMKNELVTRTVKLEVP